MGALLTTGGIVAAFFAGTVALFAPCCVVFLLPGYLAGAVKNSRWRLIPLTFVFAAGLAVVMVPITAGIGALSAAIAREHALLFGLGALLMLVLAWLSLTGRMWSLPGFVRAPDARRGDTVGFFALGVFSGVASSCCAPVLAGVMTLSALSGSPIGAAALGLAYVFGMVAPLFVLALIWDWARLGERRLTPRPIVIRFGERRLRTNLLNVIVAAGFAITGVLIGVVAVTGEMPGAQPLGAAGSWLAGAGAGLQRWLAPVPEALQGVILLALAGGLLAATLVRPRRRPASRRPEPAAPRTGAEPGREGQGR